MNVRPLQLREHDSGTVTFAPGVTNQTLSWTTLDDHIYTADKTLIVTLSNPNAPMPTFTAPLVSVPQNLTSDRARLHNELLRAALALAQSSAPGTGDSMRLLGCPVAEHDLRIALEGSYRALARFADGAQERIALVDAANRVRPRTWTWPCAPPRASCKVPSASSTPCASAA